MAPRHGGVHETRAFTNRVDRAAGVLEELAVSVPGASHGLGRVVKQVEIARQAVRLERHVQGNAARHVALATGAAQGGKGESGRREQNASRSPCCAICRSTSWRSAGVLG